LGHTEGLGSPWATQIGFCRPNNPQWPTEKEGKYIRSAVDTIKKQHLLTGQICQGSKSHSLSLTIGSDRKLIASRRQNPVDDVVVAGSRFRHCY